MLIQCRCVFSLCQDRNSGIANGLTASRTVRPTRTREAGMEHTKQPAAGGRRIRNLLLEARRIPIVIRLLLGVTALLLLVSCSWTLYQAWQLGDKIGLSVQQQVKTAPQEEFIRVTPKIGRLQQIAKQMNEPTAERIGASLPAEIPPLTVSSAQQYCTHLSPSALQSFVDAANAIRTSASTQQQKRQRQQHNRIPQQLIWNYGMWDGSLDSEASTEPIALTLASPLLSLLPPEIRARLQCWLTLQPPPLWMHLLVTRRAAEAMLQRYPPLAVAYHQFTRPVQKSDLIRYLAVREFGGLYLDLDVRPKQEPLEKLWRENEEARVMLFEETVLTPSEATSAASAYPIRHGEVEECQRIANYLFASAANHTFLDVLLEELIARAPLPISSDYDVLFTTGPALLTTVTYRFLHGASSFSSTASSASRDCTVASSLPQRDGVVIVRRPTDQRFFDHMVSGTWRNRRDSAGER